MKYHLIFEISITVEFILFFCGIYIIDLELITEYIFNREIKRQVNRLNFI